MIQTFTPNDVLKNQSGELTREESILLQTSISENRVLNSFSETLEMLDEQMPGLIQDPGEPLVQKIMDRIRRETAKS